MSATICRCLAAVAALCIAALSQAGTPEMNTATLVMGKVDPDSSYLTTWYRLLYGEAFRRLGLRLELATYPTARIASLVEQGTIDGEVARARIYADAHPELVRVDESVIDIEFALYAAKAAPELKRLDDLASLKSRISYRRGVVFCEKVLGGLSPPPAQLSDVTEARQGLMMLRNGRSDYYCDVDVSVANALRDDELKSLTPPRKALVLEAAPLYPYLHRRHAELAPRLAATLRSMKAEGLIDRYLRQAMQEAGR
jgi:polar amino acid transport system substrate-binding protein